MERTECPTCGEVWQQHTLNQIDVCTAILKQRLARHPEFSNSSMASVLVSRPVICPVCTRLLNEHTDAELDACEGKLRTRERGSTGLDSGALSFRALDHKKEDPDDAAKSAQLHSQMMQGPCSICGKPRGDHNEAEVLACANRREDERRREI
jgi:hypothetical protein